jgi:dihydroorotate dehydrogenase
MLEGGADLLQIYTSFIYGGPLTVHNLNEGLLAVMNQHEVDTV